MDEEEAFASEISSEPRSGTWLDGCWELDDSSATEAYMAATAAKVAAATTASSSSLLNVSICQVNIARLRTASGV